MACHSQAPVLWTTREVVADIVPSRVRDQEDESVLEDSNAISRLFSDISRWFRQSEYPSPPEM